MSKIQNLTGKSFEDEFMQYWKNKGYWTIKTKGIGGTAFDIIARDNILSFAFECKAVAKGNYLLYTRELQKKTDELNYYNDITEDLYIAVRFSDCVMFSEWRVARYFLQKDGRLRKEEMFPIASIELYQGGENPLFLQKYDKLCATEPSF